MGQLTQTTAQVQVILDDADAANVGKTSLTAKMYWWSAEVSLIWGVVRTGDVRVLFVSV